MRCGGSEVCGSSGATYEKRRGAGGKSSVRDECVCVGDDGIAGEGRSGIHACGGDTSIDERATARDWAGRAETVLYRGPAVSVGAAASGEQGDFRLWVGVPGGLARTWDAGYRAWRGGGVVHATREARAPAASGAERGGDHAPLGRTHLHDLGMETGV